MGNNWELSKPTLAFGEFLVNTIVVHSKCNIRSLHVDPSISSYQNTYDLSDDVSACKCFDTPHIWTVDCSCVTPNVLTDWRDSQTVFRKYYTFVEIACQSGTPWYGIHSRIETENPFHKICTLQSTWFPSGNTSSSSLNLSQGTRQLLRQNWHSLKVKNFFVRKSWGVQWISLSVR